MGTMAGLRALVVTVGADAVCVIAPAAVAPPRSRPVVATSAAAVRATARRAVGLLPCTSWVRICMGLLRSSIRTIAIERDIATRVVTHRLQADQIVGTNTPPLLRDTHQGYRMFPRGVEAPAAGSSGGENDAKSGVAGRPEPAAQLRRQREQQRL